eukprot:358346-Chlamydomonas_euryale.AAC.4
MDSDVPTLAGVQNELHQVLYIPRIGQQVNRPSTRTPGRHAVNQHMLQHMRSYGRTCMRCRWLSRAHVHWTEHSSSSADSPAARGTGLVAE